MFSKHPLYIEDVSLVSGLSLEWEKLKNSSMLISGATGLIGTFLVDVIMHKNLHDGLNCKIYALGRSVTKAQERFSDYFGDEHFIFTAHDINTPLNGFSGKECFSGKAGYVLHMASNTHPKDYAADPVGTILTNIIGLNNLLRFSLEHSAERFLFTSTVEVYGENRGDTEFFSEDYCGYIDIAKARAGYPEAKRCGETLCQSYLQQYGLDIVLPRLPRTYGSTMQKTDSKAIAQFIHKAIAAEDIVLKSAGTQLYSYAYAADSVSGILTTLFRGKTGEAYNIADENSDITLKDLAGIAAGYSGKRVVFEIPDALEKSGYSSATKARLDSQKIKALGWTAHYDIKTGITRTIQILSQQLTCPRNS
ncbi:MAG: NAD-dependent epimerase/dehydratase family protein [Synergistaceae bacterium]|nr:NAD-dependent epimerase/dehydratase family protein [Synergistaceae bacterium]